MARRIMLHTPAEEIAQDPGVAGVGFTEILDCILGKLRAFAQVEALGSSARARAVELCDHVDGSARPDLFHLAQIGNTGAIQIVVAREVDHDCPVGACARASRVLALFALGRGYRVCHVSSCLWLAPFEAPLRTQTVPKSKIALLQKKAAPKGRSKLPACGPVLPARFTVAIDRNCRSRGRAHLKAMFYATQIVSDIPVIRPAAGNVLAVLNVLAVAIAASTRVGADSRARDRAAGSGNVSASSASDLVTENAADDRAGDRTGHIGIAADPFTLDPATLLRRTDDCAHRSNLRVVKPFARALTIFVGRRCERWGHFVLVRHPIDRPHRGNSGVHAHPAKRIVTSRPQDRAAPFESRVLAYFPASAIDDCGSRAVIESGRLEVPDRLVDPEGAAAEALAFIKCDLCRRLSGAANRYHA